MSLTLLMFGDSSSKMYYDALIILAVTIVLFIFDPISTKKVRTNVEYSPPKSLKRSKTVYKTLSNVLISSETKKKVPNITCYL